ncbi:MAG: hypothetical protein Solivirus1_7 [Solivirus sp.]|uniref:Uncharacterized protein n=1 Tax=Solivirus sp. TaxID=2487772 RepID=A0A3G5AF87_9VIRU|nr:MAG: hypothetical protein Solivirus1_7 [Solivirus sp.]
MAYSKRNVAVLIAALGAQFRLINTWIEDTGCFENDMDLQLREKIDRYETMLEEVQINLDTLMHQDEEIITENVASQMAENDSEEEEEEQSVFDNYLAQGELYARLSSGFNSNDFPGILFNTGNPSFQNETLPIFAMPQSLGVQNNFPPSFETHFPPPNRGGGGNSSRNRPQPQFAPQRFPIQNQVVTGPSGSR